MIDVFIQFTSIFSFFKNPIYDLTPEVNWAFLEFFTLVECDSCNGIFPQC